MPAYLTQYCSHRVLPLLHFRKEICPTARKIHDNKLHSSNLIQMIKAVFWQRFQKSLSLSSLVLRLGSKCILFTYVEVPLIPPCQNQAFLLFAFHLKQREATILLILALGVSKWVFNAPLRKHYHCRASFYETER